MALIETNVLNNWVLCVCVCVGGGGGGCFVGGREGGREGERQILAIEKEEEMGVSECKRLGCFGVWGHWGEGYGLEFEAGYSGISHLSVQLMLH